MTVIKTGHTSNRGRGHTTHNLPEQETSFETLQHMSNMMETGLGGLGEKIRQADVVGVEELGF